MECPANAVRASDYSPCLPWIAQSTFIQVHLFCWRDWSAFANIFSMPHGETALPHALTVEGPLGLRSDADGFRTLFFVRSSIASHEKNGPEASSQSTCRQPSRSMVHDYLVSCPSLRIENFHTHSPRPSR